MDDMEQYNARHAAMMKWAEKNPSASVEAKLALYEAVIDIDRAELLASHFEAIGRGVVGFSVPPEDWWEAAKRACERCAKDDPVLHALHAGVAQ
jgi:hypothetical protein